jgi:hypothetical protein
MKRVLISFCALMVIACGCSKKSRNEAAQPAVQPPAVTTEYYTPPRLTPEMVNAITREVHSAAIVDDNVHSIKELSARTADPSGIFNTGDIVKVDSIVQIDSSNPPTAYYHFVSDDSSRTGWIDSRHLYIFDMNSTDFNTYLYSTWINTEEIRDTPIVMTKAFLDRALRNAHLSSLGTHLAVAQGGLWSVILRDGTKITRPSGKDTLVNTGTMVIAFPGTAASKNGYTVTTANGTIGSVDSASIFVFNPGEWDRYAGSDTVIEINGNPRQNAPLLFSHEFLSAAKNDYQFRGLGRKLEVIFDGR